MEHTNIKQQKTHSKVIHPWKKTEDQQLLGAIQKYGEADWNKIKDEVPTRTKKQCKERYFNHLCSRVIKDKWTKEEDSLILNKINEYGHHWTLISQFIPGRAPNSIKNRFYSHLSKVRNKYFNSTNESNSLILDSETNLIQSAFIPASSHSYTVINVNSFY
ncbi:trichome differentiation protein GL1, putative [Entamoeba dispar SAW760]|uniref:Trichome differentiation protein GL1, putative n=1 Tax=Entamoeba dispar (strain ATCC PRA-260 / SAW760) TaxID=370354 RepID=B0EF72_ENTDS|nr:trichome differentiation protein GL1, putative [Entamoeba dispar SAW760]EDR26802.1 trichome differentiation protein GL1, putative [Entamoeba dispar SAW760]|eukprot:EDR26802.1 trichome differentiation protein GL1, putative [Entamoeba dispar SAW760]